MRVLQTSRVLWLSLILLCLGNHALAENELVEAAKVVMAKGSATATDRFGNNRSLARRSVVYVGDTLRTDEDSLLQLRFTDKAVMTLRENTEFFIEQYVAGDDEKGGAAIMKLLSGGFRTITGSIGKGKSDDYTVSSKAASIGIRGTHYEAVQTDNDKLVLAVWKGGIRVTNSAGTIELGTDRQYSYSEVRPNVAPKGLVAPPPELKKPLVAMTTPSKSTNQTAAKTESEPQSENSTDEKEKTSSMEFVETGKTESPIAQKTIDTEINALTENTVETNTVNTATQDAGVPTEIKSDPTMTRSPIDPRLTVAEHNQLTTTNRLGIVTLQGPRREIQATIMAPNTSALSNDYSNANAVSFTISYNNGSTAESVVVTLNNNTYSLTSLIADINDDLSGAPIKARQQDADPSHIEFYTDDPTNYDLSFKIESIDTSTSSATDSDLLATLGGITPGTEAFGSDGSQQTDHLKVVYDANGNPVFISQITDNAASTPPIYIDTGAIPTTTPLTGYEIFRQGEAYISDYSAEVGGRNNVSWGVWNGSQSDPIYAYKDSTDYQSFEPKDETVYWLSAEAATTAQLTGSGTFTASTFIGNGSSGPVRDLSGSFDVNFDTSSISNGILDLTTDGDESWSVNYNGTFQDAQAHMTITDGSINDIANGLCTSCVTGHIDGIFVNPGDAFAGGFNLEKINDKDTHVEGLLLMEKQ